MFVKFSRAVIFSIACIMLASYTEGKPGTSTTVNCQTCVCQEDGGIICDEILCDLLGYQARCQLGAAAVHYNGAATFPDDTQHDYYARVTVPMHCVSNIVCEDKLSRWVYRTRPMLVFQSGWRVQV
ncbi:hypothetical protein C8R45DRAFT_1079167 [Mycena sanguinolenta]|nr:hypothetical protein C8R45DRAFT_1079167 [Mycena sanguinolenta]